MNHLEHAEHLNPLMERLLHWIAVPIASVGVVAPQIDEKVEVAKHIMASPLASYASAASAVYLTLMVIKTAREIYLSWKNKK
jgi:hypothetical protein